MSILKAYYNRKKKQSVYRETFLSDLLPADFVESTITFQSGIPRQNAEQYIQPFLNGGNCKIKWDRKVAISTPLRLQSDTTIIATDITKGAILATGSEKPIFMNRNIVFAGNTSIVDKNIIIDGGTWHGNNDGQQNKGTPEFGLATINSFHGVKNLQYRNCNFFEPMTYCILANNIVDGVYEDIYIDVGVNSRSNKDGVHFDGWCANCRISRLDVKTLDDAIGLNTNDAFTKKFNYPDRTFTDFYDVSMYGPITNIIIEDIHFRNSIFGIRLLSTVALVSNITIRRFTGITGEYAILIDNFQSDMNWCTPYGLGNFKNIIIDDIDVIISDRVQWGANQSAVINIAGSIDGLTATNVLGARNGSKPLYAKKPSCPLGNYIYKNIVVNGQNIT